MARPGPTIPETTHVYKLLLSVGLAKAAENDTVQNAAFSAMSALSAIAAGILTRKVLTKVWTKAAGREPPANPADPTVDWQEAVTWAAATGVGVGVGRVVGRRAAADVWERAAGEPAPAQRDLQPDQDD